VNISVDNSDKPKGLDDVTQLLGSSKLKDAKTGESLKVYKVNLQKDYIKIRVEKHDTAKLVLHKSGVGIAEGVTLKPILMLKQATGYEPEYGVPVRIGQDIPVNLFNQGFLIRPQTVKETKVRTMVSLQIAHVFGDSNISIEVVPVGL